MARIDKYQPVAGGFRAPLHAAYTGAAAAIGVGLNSSGRVVAGPGQTGIIGVICSPYDKAAGDIIDCMTNGELVEFGGVAGTRYYAHATTGVISSTPSIYPVGSTVEADRLVVRLGPPAQATNVVGDQAAVPDLTLDTAQAALTPTSVLVDVPAVVAAAGEATAADLTTTNVSLVAVNQAIADIATKVNTLITRLESAGLLTP